MRYSISSRLDLVKASSKLRQLSSISYSFSTIKSRCDVHKPALITSKYQFINVKYNMKNNQ